VGGAGDLEQSTGLGDAVACSSISSVVRRGRSPASVSARFTQDDGIGPFTNEEGENHFERAELGPDLHKPG